MVQLASENECWRLQNSPIDAAVRTLLDLMLRELAPTVSHHGSVRRLTDRSRHARHPVALSANRGFLSMTRVDGDIIRERQQPRKAVQHRVLVGARDISASMPARE